MEHRNQILIISYYLPPKNDIASMRIGGLCNYLSKQGWDIVVLTTDHQANTDRPYEVITTKSPSPIITRFIERYKDISNYSSPEKNFEPEEKNNKQIRQIKNQIEKLSRPIAHFIRDEIVHYPDRLRLWKDHAIPVANNIVSNRDISCIVSSSGPFTCHQIGSVLCQSHNLPWIADYRDPWTQNPYNSRTFVREAIEKRMEKKVIKPASEVVTVSDPIANILSNLHNRKVKTILNGYNENQHPEGELRNTFTIMYPGQFYKKRRNPEMLFSAVSKLVKNGISHNSIQIEFYGYAKQWIVDLADDYDIRECIRVFDPVDKSTILKRERESHCLLSLHWDSNNSEGFYTGKVFEYLGAKRPIVAITPPDVVNNLLNETNAGESFYDSDSLAYWLRDQYKTFKRTGHVRYDINEKKLQKYSQKRMGREFKRIIRSVV